NTASIPYLLQGHVGSVTPGTRILGHPLAGDGSRSKSCNVKRDLRMQLSLAAVVGHKISRDGVLGARPESGTAAQVIARLVPERGIAGCHESVFDSELAESRSKTPSISRGA